MKIDHVAVVNNQQNKYLSPAGIHAFLQNRIMHYEEIKSRN